MKKFFANMFGKNDGFKYVHERKAFFRKMEQEKVNVALWSQASNIRPASRAI